MQDFSYAQKTEEVLSQLNTRTSGLSIAEAKERLKSGRNVLEEEKRRSRLSIFLEQFKDVIIIILVIAVVISFLLGEYVDAAAILIILLLNATVGFIQEYRAEKAIAELKKMASKKALVIREGKKMEIEAAELVPGDIIMLEPGMIVPADARLIEAVNLETQEASLTGESMPVRKTTEPLPESTPLAERNNMVYASTIVTRGRGIAAVTSTGMKTEVGKIASLIQNPDEDITPLQKKLKKLGVQLSYIVLIICCFVLIAQLLKDSELIRLLLNLDLAIFTKPAFVQLLINSVALAVAVLPEGLPAIVTISLALGVQRMVKRNALIRKLPAVETLGCVNVICTDKTGTLTCNEMTVKKIFVDGKVAEVSGEGYSTAGKISESSKDTQLLLKIGVLCNDADIENGINGDPTEIALLVSGAKLGLSKRELSRELPRVGEIPFESERKLMSTIHLDSKRKMLLSCVKGSPEVLLRRCSKIMINGKAVRLTKKHREQIIKTNEEFGSQALRVLGFAFREFKGNKLSEKIRKNAESELTFVGLQAMIDPPRPEVQSAIEKCKSAGIRVVMITGDQKHTAEAIAKQLGIESEGVVTGEELDSTDSIESIVDRVSVYARVSPEHKIKIVEALKKKNVVVAMTGDGINDAPALKKADIGIAMGVTGTDVAKEASDMILTDDNFTSIVNAVEEGRIIYSNIKKFVRFLLSSNMGEVMIIFFAVLFGLPLPLVAVQILWINLATDGFPAIALGVEPPERDIMKKSPRKIDEEIINRKDMIIMLLISFVMSIETLLVFRSYLPDLPMARTAAFTMVVMLEMFNVLNCKNLETPLFKGGAFSNKYLIYAILSSVGIHLIILYTPLSKIFDVVPLSFTELAKIILISSSILLIGDLIKIVISKWQARESGIKN
ncbi:MAG: calcium-translocating P-type ATPase, SERCA-type [Candidatus Woesearchaeota archaeon]